MKPRQFILPLVALTVSAVWLARRHAVWDGLREEGQSLRRRVAEVRNGGGAEPAARETAGAPEWKTLAIQALRANQTSVGFGKLRKRLAELSTDEILAGLEKMGSSTSGGDNVLKELLVEALVKKDPELALDRLIGQVDESGRGGTLSTLAEGMKELTKKDPGAAVAWFDRAVAAGFFPIKRLDGINGVHEKLEGALVTGLISSDPVAAIERLKAMPEKERGTRLNDHANGPLDEAQRLAFIRIIREVLPESTRHSLISNQASQVVDQGGFAEVSKFLASFDATGGERAAVVKSAVSRKLAAQAGSRAIVREDIESMVRWASAEAPGSKDNTTGSVLNGLAWHDFPAAAALVLKYHEESGNDEILKSFFEGGADRNWPREKLRSLVERLRDEPLRNEYLEALKELE